MHFLLSNVVLVDVDFVDIAGICKMNMEVVFMSLEDVRPRKIRRSVAGDAVACRGLCFLEIVNSFGVYSFGVLVLEILSGKRSTDDASFIEMDLNIVGWVCLFFLLCENF